MPLLPALASDVSASPLSSDAKAGIKAALALAEGAIKAAIAAQAPVAPVTPATVPAAAT
jgi:hypothetical protein